MHSTMQDVPLSIATIVRYGTTVHADSEVVSYDGEHTHRVTLGELGVRAARLASGLRDLAGVRIGEPVGSFLWNQREHFEAYLAVPAMGAVLHTLNVRYTPEQMAYTAAHAEDRVIIVDESLVDVLSGVLPALPALEHLVVVGWAVEHTRLARPGLTVHSYEELLAAGQESYDWPELPETSPALMCYTSGTTGVPKGVIYSHRSTYLVCMQLCMGDYLALSSRDKALLIVPMFHTNAWNYPYAALMVGASIVLPGRHVQPPHLARLIEWERPTVSCGVPTIWADLLHHARAEGTDLSSLRDVVVGGSACPRSLMERYEQEFGVRLLHGWGMTEMSPIGTIAKPGGPVDDEAWAFRLTQGRLVCGVQARVSDPEGKILPNDGISMGEIETRGPWVTGAYHRLPDESRFHGGWLRTGDVGVISPTGVLQLRDRTKDVIKSGGEWISSLELEQALHEHPDVLDAAVIGLEDERWGERPLAVVMLRAGAAVGTDDLVAHLSARLARWQVPERWSRLEALPRTSVGKTDKVALRQLYAERSLTVETIGSP